MKRIKHRTKFQKFIKEIISSATSEKTTPFFLNLENFQQLAEKILEQEQDDYEHYFLKYMNHELNLLRIELKKIELNYKEIVFKTSQQILKFENRLSDETLKKDMREFYQKEFLNILKPQYIIEQVLENYKKYLEVLELTKEEFKEWFFLGRIDFLKQLLQPYIVKEDNKSKNEIWIYKKYEKELTQERKQKMFQKVGLNI